jgi:hypothetical protein
MYDYYRFHIEKNRITETECIVSYEPLIKYRLCTSNVPHAISNTVFEKLSKKTCPYCRATYDDNIYMNEIEEKENQ